MKGNRDFIRVLAVTLSAGFFFLGITGCGGKILRENVLATTQSALGIMLAQNAQTQAYELKIGYARNEFFLVPTSKRVINDKHNNDAAGTATTTEEVDTSGKVIKRTISGYATGIEDNDPTGTPEVLAEIQVGGGGKPAAGPGGQPGASITVYQRLAVGKIAVRSGAAIALMAQDSATAKAAAGFISERSSEENLASIAIIAQTIEALGNRAKSDSEAKRHFEALNTMAKRLTPPVTLLLEFREGNDEKSLKQLPHSITRFGNIADAVEYLKWLNDSIHAIERVQDQPAVKVQVGPSTGSENEFGQAFVAALLQSQRDVRGKFANDLTQQPEFQAAMKYFFGPLCK